MGHFYMENICTMDEQRKCELKIIAGKIGLDLIDCVFGFANTYANNADFC